MKTTPEKALTIDEFIETQRDSFDGSELRRFVGFAHRVRAKLEEPGVELQPGFAEEAERLLVALERANADGVSDPLPDDLREAGVAVRYLLKGADLIPDSVPEIGFVDDARLVSRVVERNENFGADVA